MLKQEIAVGKRRAGRLYCSEAGIVLDSTEQLMTILCPLLVGEE